MKTIPITNADWIRSMTDEDLVKSFGGGLCWSFIDDGDGTRCNQYEHCGGCYKCMLDWLRQEKK